MISPELKVSSKPPLSRTNVLLKKRHSLNTAEPLKRLTHLSRRGSHELQRKEESNSCGNLRLLDSKSRSASLAQLQTTGRTLSASNLAALSDSNLSIQVALPERSYEYSGSESNLAKQHFEVVVKRYYEQLTVGCGSANCWNKFCASNATTTKPNARIASFISIELATLGKEYFCKECPGKPLNALSLTVKPTSLTFEQNQTSLSNEQKPTSLTNEQKPVSFLHKFFSCSPFKFLFSNESTLKPSEKPRSGSLRDVRKALNISGSEGSLKLNAFMKSSDGNVGDKKSNSVITPHVNSGKVTLDSKDKVGTSDIEASPTLLDFQTDIESVDVDGDDLEQFEEECALEISSSSIKELSLTHLTLPMLEKSVEDYQQCGDSSFLVNTIRTLFSSPEALNASFQQSAKSNLISQHNISDVRNAYKLLFNLEPKARFLQPLQNSLEIHIKTLQTSKIQPTEVFQLVILLENPLILENHDLLQTICDVIANQECETRCSLVGILADYDCPGLQRIVKAVQKLLSSQVYMNQCSEPHIIRILIMLATLHDANLLSERSRNKLLVPVTDFYNHELSQKLNYKLEYEKWRGMTETHHGSNMSIFDYPFALQPASKVRIMRLHAVWQMGLEYRDAVIYQSKVHQAREVYDRDDADDKMNIQDSVKSAMNPFLVLEVRRDHLIQDTLVQLKLKENQLKKALKIRYVGSGEEGLDLGGLQKEFFHIIVNDIIQPDYGMFTYLEEVERMWINSSSLESDVLFELVGTLLGIAIHNGIMLDLRFPPVIYKKLEGVKTDLSDLKDVEPSLARSLKFLLDYDGNVENTFCYTFQVSRTVFEVPQGINLKANGDEIAVTNDNRTEFVQLYVDYLLNTSISRQFDALSRGFHKVCDATCLKLFHPEELELLICGSPLIDFSSIEESTTYDKGFSKTHPTILAFWEIVHDMNERDKKCLLSFVTGSDRVPLKGLSKVAFKIIKHGKDSDKLPTALTCFNQLMLPEYCSKEVLRSRLFLAIQNSKGFGLT